MQQLACFLWWIALGAMCGVLASWLLGALCRRPTPRPQERIVERTIERPMERIVENPASLARIRTLEAEVAASAGLRAQIAQLQAVPPKVIQDTRGIEQRDQQINVLQQRVKQLEQQNKQLSTKLKSPAIDIWAAKAAGFTLKSANDLEVIEGIGPKIAELLHSVGVTSFAELSKLSAEQLQPILDSAGAGFKLAKPETWPEQAMLAANNSWTALKHLQNKLSAGSKV